MEILIGGFYKHYKNKMYRVLDRAKHSEDLGWYVVYKALYKNDLAKTWIRPEPMFLEKVDGVDRFQLLNPDQWPTPFQVFHSHIYFDSMRVRHAEALREQIQNHPDFKDKVQISGLHAKPIGPHPTGMFEVDFHASLFEKFIPFLMEHRRGLNILIHPLSGSSLLDHTEYAMFLGEKVDLSLSIFEKVD